ncbi:unnamed protein product [Acanthoscelides obtectus]|uniref:Uncharacterized protein n=1 Tax=Acanthoscelides obtectus TaxID=200917 RepID=A0A9P0MD03_ACAOB|nr:unnamed protein product [Acanthoscelides obtectus]CAK1677390.1 Ribonuclease P protein subunit p21 [Acanthoscelides obtectus]
MSGKVKKCAGKEAFQRMNYLYQAANALVTENESKYVASIHYINLMQSISKKTVQRMDIETKRTICKGCKTLLLAGVNCRVRMKKKRLRWICNLCGQTKTFDMNNRNYCPWQQNPESTVQIVDMGSD